MMRKDKRSFSCFFAISALLLLMAPMVFAAEADNKLDQAQILSLMRSPLSAAGWDFESRRAERQGRDHT